jgi:hypothetical protein
MFDVFLFGDLRVHSVDVSHNHRVDDRDESIVNETAVD